MGYYSDLAIDTRTWEEAADDAVRDRLDWQDDREAYEATLDADPNPEQSADYLEFLQDMERSATPADDLITTECACCYSAQPCYDDGEAYICVDRTACQARQNALATPATPDPRPDAPHAHAAPTAAPASPTPAGPVCCKRPMVRDGAVWYCQKCKFWQFV